MHIGIEVMDMARHTHKPIQARMHMHADPHTYKAVVEADWENPPTLTWRAVKAKAKCCGGYEWEENVSERGQMALAENTAGRKK